MALFAQSWKRLVADARRSSGSLPPFGWPSAAGAHFRPQYLVKVGIPDFLNAVGNGVEAHAAKLEAEIGDFDRLLVTRTLRLKKLGIPCKHRKLILKYTHKYRLGLWRPCADPPKPRLA